VRIFTCQLKAMPKVALVGARAAGKVVAAAGTG